MTNVISNEIESLIRKAPVEWIASVCEILRASPASATEDNVLTLMPPTNNAVLSFQMNKVIRLASSKMTWEALSWALDTTYKMYYRWLADTHIELLWSGPSPAIQIPARRIDQTLYDLIAEAKREILLITFAATRIERLTGVMLKAVQRGVHIQLILEFEEESEGQLSFDAIRAFPKSLLSTAQVYYWPLEKRERNQVGRPGKLHAKMAIVDDNVLIASANLTDDAFNRNLEVGVMVKNREFLTNAKSYFDLLVSNGTLKLIS